MVQKRKYQTNHYIKKTLSILYLKTFLSITKAYYEDCHVYLKFTKPNVPTSFIQRQTTNNIKQT